MNLTDYQWSHNPRGMHDPGDNHARWDEWQLGWMKVVFPDNQGVSWAAFAQEKGITPMFRPFRPEFSGLPMDEGLQRLYQEHIDVGVRWFEFYNEPNIGYEWRPGADISPTNPELIRPLCENWLLWAEFMINKGCYPGFIALTETNESWGDTAAWMRSLLQYMADNHYDRFRAIIDNGMWLPTHAYIFNHWYQERPGNPTQARSAGEVNYREGGWHFEYPYDPLLQAADPGRTVFGGTPSNPGHDMYGVLGGGIAWLTLLQQMFGVGWLPVVASEGGIWPIPGQNADAVVQPDGRYPGYDLNSHGHGTVAMFDWIADAAPGWMFGVCLWREANYWNGGNTIPALRMLTESPVRLKNNIPAYPALGQAPPPYGEQAVVVQNPTPQEQPPTAQPTEQPTVEPTAVVVTDTPPTEMPATEVIMPTPVPTLTPTSTGPGPIHGVPDYHFVVLAPGFDVTWFFESAGLQAYWSRFQPTLMSNLEFIAFLPSDKSLAVTAITTPDMVDMVNTQILQRWPNVWLDRVTVNALEEMDSEFESRAENGLRYG